MEDRYTVREWAGGFHRGVAQQKRLLEAEGHIVRTKGKHYQVVDSGKSLFDFGV